ncbi:MAG TPA: ATP-binding protein [Porphyromonadaceae bacterium]|nr:ATP-binding protein [Porphyromonadaceae bacterium]
MQQSALAEIAKGQKNEAFSEAETVTDRTLMPDLPNISTHALILSGIRRCGKSTLLRQFVRRNFKDVFYLNFEDVKLYGFDIKDFVLLDRVIDETGLRVLYFDEIQIIDGWELYIRQKLDQKFQVIITGSNASLLSAELGTKLTGRHITKELFPFSYTEYLDFRGWNANGESLSAYLTEGGFPDYLKQKLPEILYFLIEDILNRDIIVRYGLKDGGAIKKLCSYLFANNGTLVVPSKLTSAVGVKSNTTILNYFSYFENSYLIAMVPKFDWSAKAQMLSAKKMYVIDPGLVQVGSTSFSRNIGHLLESVVFWHLRRKTKEIYYFNENNKECDFVVRMKDKTMQVIQVCWELTLENQEREISGLLEAMQFFKTDNGIIVSANSTDTIRTELGLVSVMPAYEYLMT